MRPVRLELEGFGAFRDRTLVDISDADLFAIVGATGHGKSTLIDAICFALYGKVPRHGERDIAPVITLGANEAKVSFTFDLGGRRYTATRILRRDIKSGGAKTRAAHLELEGGELLAGSVREVQAEVQRLIGLDFDQFTKCVVLPQGRFAEFLHAPAGDRTSILSALLDLGRYDRMAVRAREYAKESTGRRSALEQERARIGPVTGDTVKAARARQDLLAVVAADIERALPVDDQLAAAITAAHADTAAAHRALAALDQVRVPEDARAAARTARDAATRAAAVAADADRAELEAVALETARQEQPDLASLTALLDAHREHDTLADRVANGTAVLDERLTAASGANESLEHARAATDEAQAALDDAQRGHAHAELRDTLVVGEDCPVCEQVVLARPKKLSTNALAKARKALDARRAAQRKAETAAEKALADLHKADALLTDLRERHRALAVRLVDAGEAAALEAEINRIQAVAAEAIGARTRANELRVAAREVAEAVTALDRAGHQAEATLQAQRDGLVSAGMVPPASPPTTDLIERWETLAQWAAVTRPDHEKRAHEAQDAVATLSAERDALFGDLLVRADVGRASSLADLNARVAAARRDTEHAVQLVEQQLARAAELDTAVIAERSAEQVASEVGRLLDKRHFGQWLVDEALAGLTAGASEILERLSAGQYALTAAPDGELLVVDHVNADETRSVRSLSGGETFQASLALALALAGRIADLAAAGAATLESIFLDEGFGTLDPETLDVVAGTIEALGHGERVVGIVTHVPELAERMPTRLRVRKEGRTAVVTREDP